MIPIFFVVNVDLSLNSSDITELVAIYHDFDDAKVKACKIATFHGGITHRFGDESTEQIGYCYKDGAVFVRWMYEFEFDDEKPIF